MSLTEYSVVSFFVDGQTYSAHRNILHLQTPALLELARSSAGDTEIPGMSSKIFKGIIDYAYTEDLTFAEYESQDFLLLQLEAADRFACIDMKVELEVKLVEEWLDESTGVRLLLFADSHTCALLKEASIKALCHHGRRIMDSSDWKLIEKCPEIQSELLRHVVDTLSTLHQTDTSELMQLEVSNLSADGEDVDGSHIRDQELRAQ